MFSYDECMTKKTDKSLKPKSIKSKRIRLNKYTEISTQHTHPVFNTHASLRIPRLISSPLPINPYFVMTQMNHFYVLKSTSDM